MRRLLTVLLLACSAVTCSVVAAGTPALAHNVLVGSDPKDGATLTAAPARVTLVFDQAVRQGYAHVSVTGADGSSWADGAAEVAAERVSVKVGALPAGGPYVVGYRILSSDGHPVTGKITFTVSATATNAAPAAGDPAQPGSGAPSPGAVSASPGAAPASPSTPEASPAAAGASPGAAGASPGSAEASPGAAGASPGSAEAGSGSGAARPGAAEAAEAAANGGAGMAVVWIVGALVVLAAGTVVALRRAQPAAAPTAAQTTAPATAPATVPPAAPHPEDAAGSSGDDRGAGGSGEGVRA